MENYWQRSDCFRLQCRRPWFDSWVRKIHCKRDRLPTPVFLGFPCGSAGKKSVCNVGDLGSIPGLGRSPAGGHGNPLHYACLGTLMDRGAWRAAVHGVAESQRLLSDWAQHSVLMSGGHRKITAEEEMWGKRSSERCLWAGFEDGGRGHGPPGKGKEADTPLNLLEETQPLHLGLAP